MSEVAVAVLKKMITSFSLGLEVDLNPSYCKNLPSFDLFFCILIKCLRPTVSKFTGLNFGTELVPLILTWVESPLVAVLNLSSFSLLTTGSSWIKLLSSNRSIGSESIILFDS